MSRLLESLVMRSIDFDDEAAAQTEEVRIVAEQRGLSPKVEAFGSQSAQPDPQANLLAAHHLPQSPGASNAHGAIPHPSASRPPSPQGGGSFH